MNQPPTPSNNPSNPTPVTEPTKAQGAAVAPQTEAEKKAAAEKPAAPFGMKS